MHASVNFFTSNVYIKEIIGTISGTIKFPNFSCPQLLTATRLQKAVGAEILRSEESSQDGLLQRKVLNRIGVI